MNLVRALVARLTPASLFVRLALHAAT